ncbi:MAG: hypothetical protein D6683_03970 [Actinomyces sp.]|nr:MAG: hypothetical protein D6683_03970 [Actinomyces sp.]
MGRIDYPDADRAAFVRLASEVGLGEARRRLGYPASHHTARRWMDAAGVRPADPIESAKRAVEARVAWDVARRRELVDRVLDRLAERLEAPVDHRGRPAQLQATELRAAARALALLDEVAETLDRRLTEGGSGPVVEDDVEREFRRIVARLTPE